MSGVLLGIRLLRAAPKQLPKRVVDMLLAMRSAAQEVQTILRERQRIGSRDLRPLDKNHDDSWAGLHMRLSGFARIDAGERSVRARELLASLFPSGLAFLTASYEHQWVHSNTLLERIDAEELASEIDELAGDEVFLAKVREAHAAMGDALGIGESEPEHAPALGPALVALAQAIADYGRVLAGIVDVYDAKSVAMFEAAMAPRTAHLARVGGPRPSGVSEQPEPEQLDEAQLLEELDAELPQVPAIEQDDE